MAIIKLSEQNIPVYFPPTVTNLTTSAKPAIVAMSLVTVNYINYYFSENTYATGSISNGAGWIKLVPSGETLIPTYTNTEPVYDEIRKGYYESGTDNRYLLSFVKAAANFNNKKLIYNRYGDVDISKLTKDVAELQDKVAEDETEMAAIDGRVTDVETELNTFTRFPSPVFKRVFSPGTQWQLYGVAWDGTHLIVSTMTSSSNMITVFDGTTFAYIKQFDAPGPLYSNFAYNLVWDGTHLITLNINGNTIYVLDGLSATVLSSFSASGASAITFDGTNLISFVTATNLIRIHSGVSATIASSFAVDRSMGALVGVCTGLAFDGVNLYSNDAGNQRIYKHNGISGDIIGYITTVHYAKGMACDSDGHLINCDGSSTYKVYFHWNQILT